MSMKLHKNKSNNSSQKSSDFINKTLMLQIIKSLKFLETSMVETLIKKILMAKSSNKKDKIIATAQPKKEET